jgi:hypothetical protein
MSTPRLNARLGRIVHRFYQKRPGLFHRSVALTALSIDSMRSRKFVGFIR